MGNFIYAGATLFVKSSFLMLYHRIDDRRPMRWTVYVLMFVIVGQALATMVVISISYIPPAKMLSSSGDLGKCTLNVVAAQAFWNVVDIVAAVSSIAIYVTPLFILRGVQLPRVCVLATKSSYSWLTIVASKVGRGCCVCSGNIASHW